ncbi:hypothetical protein [Conexibacter sp. CPCC 206217]|uniref:hypothetical protein n=1 Tax=Conexibacter sp. CPCC 206217 TaxID=3064574 RepID=UPI002715F225|nr:hypothetical protein [Conexibacter sp. CPCC 206217]MDO8213281.1 hypothetical protein [Conexibacter sp. CPCC 206217]
MPRQRLLHCTLLVLLAALALAGCGTVGDDRPEVDATLVLDGRPQAYDAPIAAAVQRGFDSAEGVHLRLRAPRAPGAGLRALLDDRADFAVISADQLSGQPELVGIMALTNAPTGARAPRLILTTTRERLDEDPSIAKAAVAGILRGYDQTLTDPASSLSDLQEQFPGLNRRRLEAALPAAGQAMYPPSRLQGALPLNDPRYDTSVVREAAGTTHDS